jgi:PPM family protein phosphatase
MTEPRADAGAPKTTSTAHASSANGPVSVNEPGSQPVPTPGSMVAGRYRIGSLILQRGQTLRFRGLDLCSGQDDPLPIVIVRQATNEPEPPPAPSAVDEAQVLLGVLSPPSSGESLLADTKIDEAPTWPSIGWERRLLARTPHLSMPRVLDGFREDGFEYLIEEVPVGRSFWDAWEEAGSSWSRRCAWLIQIAEALDELHAGGAILDAVRPDIIMVTPTSQAVFADLSGVLPLPPPGDVAGSLYSAPELLSGDRAGPQADLYGFGAMVQALLFGRELSDLDFHAPGAPRSHLERDPDAHPMLGRLLARTFVHDVAMRFPSQDMYEDDPTGFAELIATLKTCARTLDAIRLDIAAWTNTGVVRSGNEDAVAVLHSTEARLEDCDDFALIALADGMGGMASGEVAAALTIQTVRDFFLRHPPFTDLMLSPPAPAVPGKAVDFRALIDEALREANRAVCEESRKVDNHRGMGCTAEVVLIDGKKVFIGHVGDSRVYHVRHGKIAQITEDHTLVSHLVALGQLTEAEAERHPQRAELQQAIGGRRDVYPDHYELTLESGDWLIVCSDGLSNQLKKHEMARTVQSAGSAEKAGRRLVNQALVSVALDNVSVVVVRAC